MTKGITFNIFWLLVFKDAVSVVADEISRSAEGV